jgi:hypothetical protein
MYSTYGRRISVAIKYLRSHLTERGTEYEKTYRDFDMRHTADSVRAGNKSGAADCSARAGDARADGTAGNSRHGCAVVYGLRSFER